MIEYQGYVGKVDFDDGAGIFHGEVINTRDVITFQGKSVAELKKAFQESVQDYVAFCAARGEEPEKPFSGQFVARIAPELHRQIHLAASLAGKSLNAWVAEQLQAAVSRGAKKEQAMFGKNASPTIGTKKTKGDKKIGLPQGARQRSAARRG